MWRVWKGWPGSNNDPGGLDDLNDLDDMDELDDPDIGWQGEMDDLDDLSDLEDLDGLYKLDREGILDINLNGGLHQFISLLWLLDRGWACDLKSALSRGWFAVLRRWTS